MKLDLKTTRSAAFSSIFIGLSCASLVACGDDDIGDSSTDNTADAGGDKDAGNPGTGGAGSTEDDAGAGGSETMDDASVVTEKTIAEVAAEDDRFTTLVGALEATGLDDTLSEEGPFTVFAPTDAAFELLPDGLVTGLDDETLAAVLSYHVVAGKVEAEDVVELTEAQTVQGDDLRISVSAGKVYLNGLTEVTVTDIQTANGVIHVIDSVLIPGAFPGTLVDAVTSYPRLSTLADAVTEDIAIALSGDGLTLLAPVNDAFDGVTVPEETADLEALLAYHALPLNAPAETVVTLKSAKSVGGPYMGIQFSDDDGVQINDSDKLTKVIYTDFKVDSGAEDSVIHLIEKVLVPPGNIAEVAAKAGLTSLVTLAGIVDVPGTDVKFAAELQKEGPFTVFAPTNEAFPALGFGNSGDVLGAHAIGALVDSNAVVAAIEADGKSPDTLTGAAEKQLGLSLLDGKVVINAMVQVTATDIPASNGIIHLVDSVILPASETFPGSMVQAVSAYPIFSSLVTAVGNADAAVGTTLSGTGDNLTLFAPVNAAFEGIDVTQDLTQTLLYHATSAGAFDSAAVVAAFATAGPLTMANANADDTTVDATALTVNDSNLIGFDLRTSTGIIHILDKVLTPPAAP